MALIIELSPEREAELRAQAEAHGLSLENWLVSLADERPNESPSTEREARPIWEVIVERMGRLPASAFDSLPIDGASELDHYLYGTPKRNS